MDETIECIRCRIYTASKRDQIYLYVPANEDLNRVPEPLITSLGHLKLVMELDLHAERRLARVDVKTVIAQLRQSGFYLQMPPLNPIFEASTHDQTK